MELLNAQQVGLCAFLANLCWHQLLMRKLTFWQQALLWPHSLNFSCHADSCVLCENPFAVVAKGVTLVWFIRLLPWENWRSRCFSYCPQRWCNIFCRTLFIVCMFWCPCVTMHPCDLPRNEPPPLLSICSQLPLGVPAQKRFQPGWRF